jgi:c-di-GMP-binding flagellar brake protein YcgR
MSALDTEQPASIELTLHDISCGGLAVVTPPSLFTPEIGVKYNCTIALPGTSGVRAVIQARNAFMITLANGKVSQRSGFAFVRPAESLLATIQRYIMNLERARRQNSRG